MKCPYCGKEFVPTSPRQKYCSKKCCHDSSARFGKYQTKQQIICRICGKKFTPKNTTTELFCSRECRKEATRQREKVYAARRKEQQQSRRQAQQRAQAVVDKAIKRPTKTIDDWAREAFACGLDYGTYRAMIDRGKTFEELKAQYEKRGRS